MTAARRVFEVLETALSDTTVPETAVPDKTLPALLISGSRRERDLDLGHQVITLNDVTLAYPGRPAPALSEVTLEIRPGEHLVVTGPSGAGKSSLLALLLRFAEPTAGRIEVAGAALAATLLVLAPAAGVLAAGLLAAGVAIPWLAVPPSPG